jgi:7-keto-8-aminopelargonate synthetase-like enzyme
MTSVAGIHSPVTPLMDPRTGLATFHRGAGGELFEKCRAFRAFTDELRARGLFQAQYRVTLEGALDHSIRVRDPFTGRSRAMRCFDSNSYLGLHLHPRVVAAVRRVLGRTGYGTPSAQVLGGTNRWLRELEETISAFYDRADTIVFPTGYAANVGALTGLLGQDDLVVRDRFSHASVHDGCRWSGARFGGAYAHLDAGDCERLLLRDAPRADGRLVVTDGVFSMHGRIAPLPELLAAARRHGARLMVDEAHSLGVVGATGRGLEEHFGLPGAIDVLMGTFSKSPGSLGGYVTGGRDLVEYLRFFARPSMFTASLPAPICAGVTEAFRVMASEPAHRERLWANARRLHGLLAAGGLPVAPLESPILPVFLGDEKLLWRLGRELFDRGVKCGGVSYPAVPRGESILRLTVNARHRSEELEETADAIVALGRRYGILGRSREEIQEIGRRLEIAEARASG